MASTMIDLPPSLRVIVRGWLNCNQLVLLDAGEGNVLVDSGYHTHAGATLARLRAPEALGEAPLARLVNTHCHSDHIGGNAAVVERYDCRVTIPSGEAPEVDDWQRQERWNAYVDQETRRFRYDDTLAPGEVFHAGGLEWQAHAAPGHDMEALMFFEPRHGLLISGDALWSNGLGFVWPHEGHNPFIDAALATLDRIEELAPRVVLPGHGEPFGDVADAVTRARSRLLAFAADPRKTARHMMKVMLVFSLLHRGSLEAAAANDYVRGVPVYADLNARFLGEDPGTLGERLAGELAASGAVRIEGRRIFPTMAA
jgi:glyoxylase-like metal-dependent hydrolase (beta-lactamase superfamily II)